MSTEIIDQEQPSRTCSSFGSLCIYRMTHGGLCVCVWRCALEVGSIIWNNQQMRMAGVRPPPPSSPACHYLCVRFGEPWQRRNKNKPACRSLVESVNELCCVFIERYGSKIDRGRKALEWQFLFFRFWGRPLQPVSKHFVDFKRAFLR